MSTVFELVLAAFREPGLVADLRDKQLPEDLAQVIRLAAGEDAALQGAVDTTGEVAETLIDASVFFLQQVLFAPGAESYRVLGADPDASQDRIRENYRWLMKWLHPDRNQDGWEAVYADRVNMAWQDLKTPDRRAEYDARMPVSTTALAPMSTSLVRRSTPVSHDAPAGPLLSGSTVRRLPTLVLGTLGFVAAATIALMYWAQTQTARELSEWRRDRGNPVAADTRAGTAIDAGAAATGDADSGVDALPLPEAPAAEPISAAPDDAVFAATMDSPAAPLPAAVFAATDPVAPHLDVTSEPPVESGVPEAAVPPSIPIESVVAVASTVAASSDQTGQIDMVDTTGTPAVPLASTITSLAPEPTADDERIASVAQLQAAPSSREPTTIDEAPPRPSAPSAISTPTVTTVQAMPTGAVDELVQVPEPASQTVAATTTAGVAPKQQVLDPVPRPAVAAAAGGDRPAVVAPGRSSPPASTAIADAPVAVREQAAHGRAIPESRPAPAPAPTGREGHAMDSATASAAATLREPAAPPGIPVVADAPAQSDAEALVREFASAYASGDLARFNRLFSSASAVSGAVGPMRSRFSSTEMRYLEIQQVRWHSEAAQGYVRARFRDTYVPRGGRKAVTESGEIEWTIRVDAGDARIASVARNDARP